jgi:hypothetical protein
MKRNKYKVANFTMDIHGTPEFMKGMSEFIDECKNLKKTKGAILGEEIRQKCNKLTSKERKKLHKDGFKLINQGLDQIDTFDTR